MITYWDGLKEWMVEVFSLEISKTRTSHLSGVMLRDAFKFPSSPNAHILIHKQHSKLIETVFLKSTESRNDSFPQY